MPTARSPEPWLRGTLTEIPAIQRAALHALELAIEDLERWCWPLSEEQLNVSVGDLAPVAFHIRHIARSIDRLLTYAEGGPLSEEQLSSLKSELSESTSKEGLFAEVKETLAKAADRIKKFDPNDLESVRLVGKRKLPTTLGGLLVHIAEHTQRHVGQAITTARIVCYLKTSSEVSKL